MSKQRKILKPPKGLPAHVVEKWWLLYRYANGIAALYGAPVYLCGSALRRDNPDPRDWDIRVIMSDAAFERRYGAVGKWNDEGLTGNYGRVRWRWSADCVKQARRGWQDTRLNVDLQVYPKSHDFVYAGKKRVRIDTRGRR